MRLLRMWRFARPGHQPQSRIVPPPVTASVATRVAPVFREPLRPAAHLGMALLLAAGALTAMDPVQSGPLAMAPMAGRDIQYLEPDADHVAERLVPLALMDVAAALPVATPFRPDHEDPHPEEGEPSPPTIALAAPLDPVTALRAEPPAGQVTFHHASLTMALSIPILKPPVPAGRGGDAAIDPKRQRHERLKQKVHFKTTTRDDCLPKSLMGVIYDIADLFGDVHIASTYRDPRRNARVGGATRSMHLECRAIDFRVGGNRKTILDYLRKRPEVGGYKLYPLGFFHIDNGPRRSW